MNGTLQMINNKKVVILGAGPAGLTAAYQLSKLNVQSIVLEKSHEVGGLSKTIKYKNFYFDIGGHRFFTKVKEIESMWKEILKDDLAVYGLEDTLKSVKNGQVELLIIEKDYKLRGWICENCQVVEEGTNNSCPYCGKKY